MTEHTETVQILRDAAGHPAFAVIPFAQYQALISGHNPGKAVPGIPGDVLENCVMNNVSPVKAWREHLEMTQAEVAARMDIKQSSYAELEAKKNIRKSSRVKIAAALGISESQLDF